MRSILGGFLLPMVLLTEPERRERKLISGTMLFSGLKFLIGSWENTKGTWVWRLTALFSCLDLSFSPLLVLEIEYYCAIFEMLKQQKPKMQDEDDRQLYRSQIINKLQDIVEIIIQDVMKNGHEVLEKAHPVHPVEKTNY
ncbi:hypothetical protein ACS0TY_003246 [Phlomoides rotata]